MAHRQSFRLKGTHSQCLAAFIISIFFVLNIMRPAVHSWGGFWFVLFCCFLFGGGWGFLQPKQGENVLVTKQLLVFFSKEIKMPFIFSKANNVEEAKIHQRLKAKRKGPALTTSFFR